MSFRVEYKQDCPENCWECPCSVADSTTSVYCHALQKHIEVDPYDESIPLECKLVDTADLDFKIEKKYDIVNKDGAKACKAITLDSFTILHYWISQTPNIKIIGSQLNPLGREIKITYVEDLPNTTIGLPDSTPTLTSEDVQNRLKEDSDRN